MTIFRSVSMLINTAIYEHYAVKPEQVQNVELTPGRVSANRDEVWRLVDAYRTEYDDLVFMADTVNNQMLRLEDKQRKQGLTEKEELRVASLRLKYSRTIRQAEQLQLKIRSIENRCE